MISKMDIDKIINIIADTENPDQVILFGSYSRDSATEDSDLDLLIIKETTIPPNKRCRELRKKLRGLKVPIDLLMYTPSEINEWKETKSAFITKILENGMILYGKDN